MRRICNFGIICSVMLGFFSACDEDGVSTGTDRPPHFNDYVHFRDIGLTRVSEVKPGSQAVLEDFIYCEGVIGEPFWDVNDNGIFEPDIDSFVSSADPDLNQDLNHDGRHNGPDEQWTPGIPFDDIDGDGFYRCIGSAVSSMYAPGIPFCDFNLNGRRDGSPGRRYFVTETRLTEETDFSVRFDFIQKDSAYLFISDSGISYYFPEPRSHESITSNLSFLIRNDSGLVCNVLGRRIPVLDTGLIISGTSTLVLFESMFDTLTARRHIQFNRTAQLDGRSFHDMVTIRVDSFMIRNRHFGRDRDQFFYEWMFERESGLMRVRIKEANSEPIKVLWTHDRFDSIPLPMTR